MVTRSFRVDFFECLRYNINSSANRNILSVSLPVYIPFISSSCPIVLARNSSTISNKSGYSEHPCLIRDFRGNGFSFSPLRMMLPVNDFTDVSLDSVCHYFIEDFALMFIKEIDLWFSFLEISLPGLGMSVILAS
jgi:hypothetical protein